jgi:branched-chain amino acid transport system ATP-binding protein
VSLTELPAHPTKGGGPALLDISGIEVTYEKVQVAIQGVSVKVREGKIVAVLGANGAGKSTLMRAVCGFLPGERAEVSSGDIQLEGKSIVGWAPHRTSRHGVVMVPERDKIFPTLTIRDNLRCGIHGRLGGTDAVMAQVLEIFPVLALRPRRIAGYLSGGERQMLAIASALLCQPRVLLIDELSLGLAPKLVDELFSLVRQISQERALTVLLVEQNARAALRIADYAYVLESGRIMIDGTPERLMAHEDVREFYLGLGVEGSDARSFAQVKQYRRRRRWWG